MRDEIDYSVFMVQASPSTLANWLYETVFFLLSKVGKELGPCYNIFSYFFFFDLIKKIEWSQLKGGPAYQESEIYIEDLVIQYLRYKLILLDL